MGDKRGRSCDGTKYIRGVTDLCKKVSISLEFHLWLKDSFESALLDFVYSGLNRYI